MRRRATPNLSLSDHYTHLLLSRLTTLWHQKLIMMGAIVAAAALGTIAAIIMPKHFTAEAYIRGGFAGPNPGVTVQEGKSTGPVVAWDASVLVETQSRLLESHQLARLVVDRLGIERLEPALGPISISWWQHTINGSNTEAPGYLEDLAAERLMHGLLVKADPRSYLISVAYTARDADLASLIANTFVAEFVRLTTVQNLSAQLGNAQSALVAQLPQYGDRHPKILEAEARIKTAQNLITREQELRPEEILQAAGENVTLAQAVHVPSSPNALVIITMSLLFGVLAGAAIIFGFARLRTVLSGGIGQNFTSRPARVR